MAGVDKEHIAAPQRHLLIATNEQRFAAKVHAGHVQVPVRPRNLGFPCEPWTPWPEIITTASPESRTDDCMPSCRLLTVNFAAASAQAPLLYKKRSSACCIDACCWGQNPKIVLPNQLDDDSLWVKQREFVS